MSDRNYHRERTRWAREYLKRYDLNPNRKKNIEMELFYKFLINRTKYMSIRASK